MTTRLQILVVEDCSGVRDSLAQMLESRGHRVRTASDGVAGVLEASIHPFHLILLDVNLPGLSGPRVMGHLRRIQSRAVTVGMTGGASQREIAEMVRQGAVFCLSKPLEPGDLDRALAAAERVTEGKFLSHSCVAASVP